MCEQEKEKYSGLCKRLGEMVQETFAGVQSTRPEEGPGRDSVIDLVRKMLDTVKEDLAGELPPDVSIDVGEIKEVPSKHDGEDKTVTLEWRTCDKDNREECANFVFVAPPMKDWAYHIKWYGFQATDPEKPDKLTGPHLARIMLRILPGNIVNFLQWCDKRCPLPE